MNHYKKLVPPCTRYLWNVRLDFVPEQIFRSGATTQMNVFSNDSLRNEILVGVKKTTSDTHYGTGRKY